LCGMAAVFYMNFLTSVNFLLFGFVSMGVSVLVAYILSFLFPESNTLVGLTWKTLDKSVKS
jgi:sodium:solute symporter family protein